MRKSSRKRSRTKRTSRGSFLELFEDEWDEDGLIFTPRTTVVSSNLPLWRSASLDANANCTPDIVRKSELHCSIVGVGSTSTCNGRTSRRRGINQLFGST